MIRAIIAATVLCVAATPAMSESSVRQNKHSYFGILSAPQAQRHVAAEGSGAPSGLVSSSEMGFFGILSANPNANPNSATGPNAIERNTFKRTRPAQYRFIN